MQNSMLYKLNKFSYKFTGPDLIDLLNRISTNTISMDSEAVSTLLLNEKGKLLDQLFIVQNNDDNIIFFNSKDSIEWIDKFTFTESYTLEETNFDLIEQILNNNDDKSDFKLNNRHFKIEKENKSSDYVNLDEYNKYRIEHFIQDYPNEISINYNPLEIGMINHIDFKKGCYTGQEIVARLEAFKKVSKYLVQIKSNEHLDVNDIVEINNNALGKVTTVSPKSNLSLAVVHRSIAKIGEAITVISKKNKIKAEIVNVLDKFTYQNI